MSKLDHTTVRFDPPASAQRWPQVSRAALTFAALWVPTTLLALLTGWRGSWEAPSEAGPMLSDFMLYGSAISGPLAPQLILVVAALLARRRGRIGAAGTVVIGVFGLLIAINGVGNALTEADHAPQVAAVIAGVGFTAFGVILAGAAWVRLKHWSEDPAPAARAPGGRRALARLFRAVGIGAVALGFAASAPVIAPPAEASDGASAAKRCKKHKGKKAKKRGRCTRKPGSGPPPQASPPAPAPAPQPPSEPTLRASLTWSGANADLDLVMFDLEGNTTFGDYSDIPETFHTGDVAGETGTEELFDRRWPSTRQFSYGVCAFPVGGERPLVDYEIAVRLADGSTDTASGTLGGSKAAVEFVPPGAYEIDPDDDDSWCTG